jgi:hypothetical protein
VDLNITERALFMPLSNKQQNGRKAPELVAEIVKDDVCDSHMPESHEQENENDGPPFCGRHD